MQKGNVRPQKLAAKAAKRKLVVAEKKKRDQLWNSLENRIALAADCPVERCLCGGDLFDQGIGYVIIAKRLPSHVLSCAFFLVDTYCLGVKDAFHRELSPMKLDERLETLREVRELVALEPADARKLLRDAAAYAAQAKLRPAKDYIAIEAIFGSANADDSAATFTFGKNGQPLFIPGPSDTPRRVAEVTAALNLHVGQGNWNYLMPMGGPLVFGQDDKDETLDGGRVIEHDDAEFKPEGQLGPE